MLSKFYISEYEGEMVSQNISWKQGKKANNQIWIPKTIINDENEVGTAHVIGNGASRKKFDLGLLHGQYGGFADLIPRSVGQSYGCNALYTEFNPTFLVSVNPDVTKKIAKSNYCEENIVYSNPTNMTRHPNLFHLFPLYPGPISAGALALLLACADGHTKIFMIGFDFYIDNDTHIYPQTDNAYGKLPEDPTSINTQWENKLCEIMTLYNQVQFYRVVAHQGLAVPESWKWLSNVEQIGYQQYHGIAHLGSVVK
jgi:hypothetical protein